MVLKLASNIPRWDLFKSLSLKIMRLDIITIFPGMFTDLFDFSIIRRAIDKGIAEITPGPNTAVSMIILTAVERGWL